MKKKIESLTPKQESQMIQFREECRAIGLSTERVDKEKTKETITKMYALIGKPAPQFIFCPSLMFAQFQIAYCEELFKIIEKGGLGANLRANLWVNIGANLEDNLGANLEDNLGANIGANLRANLEDNLGANLGNNLRDNLRANLEDNLWDNLGNNLRANLRANLGDNLGDNLRDNLRDNLGDKLGDTLRDNLRVNLRVNIGDNLRANLGANIGANLEANLRANLRANLLDNLWANLKKGYKPTDFWGSMDMYWIAFYQYPEKFLGVEYKPEDSTRLKLMGDLAESSSWFWAYENYCFVADRPSKILMDENKQLHSI